MPTIDGALCLGFPRDDFLPSGTAGTRRLDRPSAPPVSRRTAMQSRVRREGSPVLHLSPSGLSSHGRAPPVADCGAAPRVYPQASPAILSSLFRLFWAVVDDEAQRGRVRAPLTRPPAHSAVLLPVAVSLCFGDRQAAARTRPDRPRRLLVVSRRAPPVGTRR